MHQSVYPLHQITTLNFGLVLKTLDELSEESALKKIADLNCANWIMGHLVTGRHFLVGLVGSKNTAPLGDIYNRGAVITEESQYRRLSEIKDTWVLIGENLEAAFSHVTQERLSDQAPLDFPVQDKTVLGGLAFLTSHESYHLGQLSIIRKEFGLGTLFG